MSLSPRKWRVLSLLALAIMVGTAALAIALPGVKTATLRGTLDTYPPAMRGGETLRVGTNTELGQYDAATLDARLQLLATRGVRVVRQEFRWDEIEPARGRFDWLASDRLMTALKKHKIEVLVVLRNSPAWARAATGNPSRPATTSAPPADAADFARFARAFAERHAGTGSGVIGFQIWDEPNLSAAWGDAVVDPARYLVLLRTAGDALRAVQPAIPIVLAGLAPTREWTDANQPAHVYLARLYDLGGADAFDIVATKSFGFDDSAFDRRVEPDVLNFSHAVLVYETMVGKGDTAKAIWLHGGGWNSLPAGWAGERSLWGGVDDSEQARNVRDAVLRAADEWYWAGALFLQELEPDTPRDAARWGFGLLTREGQPRPVFDALAAVVEDARFAARGQTFAVCNDRARPACHDPNPNARFSPGWRFDALGADAPFDEAALATQTLDDDPKVSFTFRGDALALHVRRGDYRANAFVDIDGMPANQLMQEPRGAFLPMWSADLQPRTERIEVARGLSPGEHTATITLERGWNQWALIGWSSQRSSNSARSTDFSLLRVLCVLLALVAGALLVMCLLRAQWRPWLVSTGARNITPLALASALLLWGASAVAWATEASFAWRALLPTAAWAMGGLASAAWVWAPALALSVLGLLLLGAVTFWRLDVGLGLLALFVPFYLLPQRVFAYSLPMVEVMTVLCTLSLGARLLRPANARLQLPSLSLLDVGVLAWLLVGAISTALAQQAVPAMRELRLVFVEPALAYALLRLAPLSNTQRFRVLHMLMLGGVIIACIGLFNFARGTVFPAEFGLPRLRSIYGSPNNDALLLGRMLVLVLGLGLAKVWVPAKLHDGATPPPTFASPWLLAIPLALALVLTQSRGALLLGMPTAVVALLLARGSRARVLGLGLAALSVLGLLLLASGMLNPLLSGTRLANALDLQRGTGFFRLNLWVSAWQMFLDHPWFGVGPDNFLYQYRSAYILPAAWQEPNLNHPHNVFFDWVSRLGAAGLIALTALLLGAARAIQQALRSHDALALPAVGLLAYVFAHGMVDHSFFLTDLAFVWMIVFGLLQARPK